MNKKVFIVMSAHNEENAIAKVISDLKQNGYKNVIVVDDGSKDKTYEIAKSAGATVLRHIINRGQGAGLKTGIDHALENNADIIVTYDADGQFLASEVQKMVGPVEREYVDVTIGSRFLGEARNIPLPRKVALKLGIIFLKLLYGIKVTDSQNGFKALSRKAAQMMNIKSDKMEHATEMLGEIAAKKLSFIEVPVTVIYDDYSSTHSHQGNTFVAAVENGGRSILRKLMR